MQKQRSFAVEGSHFYCYSSVVLLNQSFIGVALNKSFLLSLPPSGYTLRLRVKIHVRHLPKHLRGQPRCRRSDSPLAVCSLPHSLSFK